MRPALTLLFALLLATPGQAAAPEGPTTKIDFVSDVQPILRRHCYRCHGPNDAEGGIRFHDRTSALGLGDSGEPLIVPHKPDDSLLMTRLTDNTWGDVMPLDAEPLGPEQIAVITRWIAEGAEWPESESDDIHWAYRGVERPETPSVNNDAWPANPIDDFVLARLEREGLTPRPEADRAKLLRRASLALIGVPPSPEELKAFLSDTSPKAYEAAVDRLLNDPRYGERWAVHWLDLARYADSNGYQADQLRDSWAYRDWVIGAFNRGQPFDEFVFEQLAGDLLPEPTMDQLVATGFHRTVTCNVEAGVHPEENRVAQVFDRVNTTGTVLLGTTMECAQCHDHKYDPISQKDYYRLFAYFNNTPLEVKQNSGVQYNFVGPKMSLPLDEAEQETSTTLNNRLDEIEAERRELRAEALTGFDTWRADVRDALKGGVPEYEVLTPSHFASTGGESYERLDDGSILVGGKAPETATYTLVIENLPKTIVGLKIEGLADERIPGNGPGRGGEGRPNFVLHEFTAKLVDGTSKTPLAMNRPEADYSQRNYDVAGAIDGDPKTAWAIGREFGKTHWASFRLVNGIRTQAGQSLELTLEQNFGNGLVIGRLRVSALSGHPDAADLNERLAKLVKREGLGDKFRKELEDHYLSHHDGIARLDAEANRIRRKLKGLEPPTTLVMVEMDQPRVTHVMNRGNYLDKGEAVTPGTPEALHPLDESLPKDRLGLAQWVTSRDNPLLARVTINRFWLEIFGAGLVATPEDFGTQGELPSHPALLDWLADEFVASGWSVRHMHKLMVTSATFRQDSRTTPELLTTDPNNRLLAHGPRFRLPAEFIRDNALAIGGLLSDRMYGEPIMPYQPPGLWRGIGRNQPTWITEPDEDRFRRGLYVVWKRSAPYPSFINFDAPDRASCTVKRPRTNTPLQALTLLNDPAYVEAGVGLAQRVLRERPEASAEDRANYAFRLCTARDPSAAETEIIVELYETEKAKLVKDPKLASERLANLPEQWHETSLDTVELGAWFAVANALLSLDETVTQN